MTAQYISIDDQKKRIPGYKPKEAENFHRESAKSADELFAHALKRDPSTNVILPCGGSASGKTEFCSEYLTECASNTEEGNRHSSRDSVH